MSAPVVEISLDQLAKNLGESAAYADRSMGEVRMDAAKRIMASMLRRVPRDTGYLASKISIKHTPTRTEIGPDGVDYAAYVEYGTPPHEIKRKTATALKFTINGRTFYAKSVRHPGTRAQPYIRPAAQEWLDYIAVSSANAAVTMLVKK